MSLTIDLGFHSTEWISMSKEFIRSKFFRDAGWGKTSKENLKKQSRIFLDGILCFVKYTPRRKQSKSATREKHCWNFMNFCRGQQIFQKNDRAGEKQWIHQNLQDE